MTATVLPVLPTMTDPRWDRPLTPVLIAAGVDLAHRCAQCSRLLLDHDGPLIVGVSVNGLPAPLYGDEGCADASSVLPGDAWDGGWIPAADVHEKGSAA